MHLYLLQELYLAKNPHMTGGLEPLQGLTALRELHMSGSRLKGSLEPLIGLTALEWLDLSHNYLTGE